MYYLEIILIGIGLAMDSFVVSISNGIIVKKIKISYPLKIAFSFGIFQAVMPLLGWLIGISFKNLISSTDHWLAFGLLGLIGLKMIRESLKSKQEKQVPLLNNKVLIIQSIATSIDSLIIGTSLAFLNFPIITSVIIIGLITFAFAFCGVYIGKRCGCYLQNKAGIIGGLILITIGLKILIQHLYQ